eukprot:71445-Prorocentrum_minimum.AAC.1
MRSARVGSGADRYDSGRSPTELRGMGSPTSAAQRGAMYDNGGGTPTEWRGTTSSPVSAAQRGAALL